ncbi:MAG: hypothetical protein H7338_04360, partial [Candidatus Sericytochromatia bacterium]|nr:hypothetical protein [Candidatus Sericytochromatia bacterium]
MAYVHHMLLHASRVVSRAKIVDRSTFDVNEDIQIIFLHRVQTIGACARRVSLDFRGKYPSVPWQRLTDISSRIGQDDLDIDFDVLWNVVTLELGTLIEALTPIIHAEGSTTKGANPIITDENGLEAPRRAGEMSARTPTVRQVAAEHTTAMSFPAVTACPDGAKW